MSQFDADQGPPSPTSAGAVHSERQPIHAYPANVTYRNLLAENRRKSALLVFAMVVFAIVVGAAAGVVLGGVQGGGRAALPAALGGAAIFGVIASFASAWSWFSGADAILSMAGAKPLEKSDDAQLYNVVDELAISAGVPSPKVYLIDDPSLNAFATGCDPAHAAIAITTGLRSQLTRDELAGVMAHEMSHVRHNDIRLMMLMATMAGLIVFVGDLARNLRFYGGVGGSSRRGDSKGGNPLALILLLVSVVILVIAPIIATLLRLAISRQREYLADAGAVELTRYPEGLIGALTKLGNNRTPLRRHNEAIAPLFIVNPARRAVEDGRQDRSSMFLTHPPLNERIERLRALS